MKLLHKNSSPCNRAIQLETALILSPCFCEFGLIYEIPNTQWYLMKKIQMTGPKFIKSKITYIIYSLLLFNRTLEHTASSRLPEPSNVYNIPDAQDSYTGCKGIRFSTLRIDSTETVLKEIIWFSQERHITKLANPSEDTSYSYWQHANAYLLLPFFFQCWMFPLSVGNVSLSR